MERKGMFTSTKSSNNQCKDVGHKYYDYICIIKFQPELDYQGFLIDHQKIDDTINSLPNTESCEECLLEMFKKMSRILTKSAKHLEIRVMPRNADAFLTLKSAL